MRASLSSLSALVIPPHPAGDDRIVPLARRVLIVEPSDSTRRAIHLAFAQMGADVRSADPGDLPAEGGPWHLVIAPPDLIADLVARDLGPIWVYAPADPAAGLTAVEQGATDCLLDLDRASVALALHRASRPPARVRAQRGATSRLLGTSAAMMELRATIERIAPHRSTALVHGESGTGKELVARALHDASGRRGRFVAINCAAIPGPLLESELFGHVKGAFTDAGRDKPGLFEDADGGTIFLDEIGELPLGLQVKLLRVLQDSEVRRIGASATTAIDVRVVAATLRDLAAMARTGRFREDLFYRLNVIPVQVPPLRDRREDVPLLTQHFIQLYAEKNGKAITGCTAAALARLADYPWPGNVRELENAIERAVVLTRANVLDEDALPREIRDAASAGAPAMTFAIGTPLADIEMRVIRETLRHTRGDKRLTAKLLGIATRTIYRRLEAVGEPPDPNADLGDGNDPSETDDNHDDSTGAAAGDDRNHAGDARPGGA